jgi:hypothetical protein
MRRIILEDLNIISKHDAIERKFFGPVYHGTTEETRSKIEKEGFRIHYDSLNGYPMTPYYDNIPAPKHHLGFGIYFTTIKAIAKRYNFGTTRGIIEYYLDISGEELYTFNFASQKKMMIWWLKNGYDGELAKTGEAGREVATIKMTEFLSKKYKAIWFTGKSMKGHALDGDQIVLFDVDRIYKVDPKLSIGVGLVVGAKVIRKADGMIGVIKNKSAIGVQHIEYLNSIGKPIDTDGHWYTVTWKKGGTAYNITSNDIEATS